MSQTLSFPLRIEPPPQPIPRHWSRSNAQVHHPRHPYHAPARPSQALPVRQRTTSVSSSSVNSPDLLLQPFSASWIETRKKSPCGKTSPISTSSCSQTAAYHLSCSAHTGLGSAHKSAVSHQYHNSEASVPPSTCSEDSAVLGSSE